jgi:hypothetical protein
VSSVRVANNTTNTTMMLLYALLIMLTRIDTTVAGWVDPSSQLIPSRLITTSLIDGTEYDLVMSDEFETDGRGFADGEDRYVGQESKWRARGERVRQESEQKQPTTTNPTCNPTCNPYNATHQRLDGP